MFIQHKQLKHLAVPAAKIAHLHLSSGVVQLAFSGYAPQPCSAYLVRLHGHGKALIVVAFYLSENCCTIFFVPRQGEVPEAAAEHMYEEGFQFVESMGFILTETDYHMLSASQQQEYWSNIPISQPPAKTSGLHPSAKSDSERQRLRAESLSSLGRFLASM